MSTPKSYRYSHVAKAEIEKIVVDYRQLNSMTVKHDYPIRVIDELVNELHGAVVFFK